MWVGCCAGYLLAGHCRLVFLSLLCLHRQAKSEPGHTHFATPIPRLFDVFLHHMLRLSRSESFRQAALLPSSNNLHYLTSHLSSIYHRYLYSPSVMTDGRHTAVSSLTVSLTTPSLFTSTIVHNIRTLNSQLRCTIPNHAVQNVLCYILYIRKKLACGRSGTSALPQPM